MKNSVSISKIVCDQIAHRANMGGLVCLIRRCDRVLWRGNGLKQMWYVRGESRFSDHRPVSSLFTAQLDDNGSVRAGQGQEFDPTNSIVESSSSSSSGSGSSWGRVGEEELLLFGMTAESSLGSARF